MIRVALFLVIEDHHQEAPRISLTECYAVLLDLMLRDPLDSSSSMMVMIMVLFDPRVGERQHS
jgi:hypothetical protein